jgi:2-keto-4-pentenoate hydratase/2-oxohepta-3-ene-1,7-dioic acid hydratase in catechol pathway
VKLATATLDGHAVWGPVVEGRLHDVSGTWASPAALLEATTDLAGRVEVGRAADDASSYDIERLMLLPPIPNPRRILCVGINYADHAAETNRSTEATAHPVIFTRFASSLVGDGHPLVRPAASAEYDYEGELAVVIGRRTRGVAPGEALAAVGGYSCFMDGSVRDFQRHTSQFTPGKNFDRSGSWGPWIVTLDEIGNGSGLDLTTRVDGVVVQHASTSQLVHDCAAIVSYCSTFTTLEPGDVIATGTPAGVGAAKVPPLWLVPGSEVSVSISGVGTLRNTVVDEPVEATNDATADRSLDTVVDG